MNKIGGIDLFCGVGGLTHGLQQAGIKIYAGIDIDKSCEFAYSSNNDAIFINKDIRNLKSSEVTDYFTRNQYSIIAGCAPCQPFSRYTGNIKKKDEKWELINYFYTITKDILPDFVTMENVPNLRKQVIFLNFVNNLIKLGYYVNYQVVYCPDYGIPQSRSRLVLIASKHGEINLIPPTHKKQDYITVKDAIYDLPKIKAGEKYAKDKLHVSSKLSEINLKRIKCSKPGGSWREWPEELIVNCHKKSTGATYGSVYGRMEWEKPSPTITTQCYGYGNGRFGHPEQNRAISLREAAILQTFPKNYQFINPNSSFCMREIGTLIGNAVPVKLGEIIGLSFIEHMKTLKTPKVC